MNTLLMIVGYKGQSLTSTLEQYKGDRGSIKAVKRDGSWFVTGVVVDRVVGL